MGVILLGSAVEYLVCALFSVQGLSDKALLLQCMSLLLEVLFSLQKPLPECSQRRL